MRSEVKSMNNQENQNKIVSWYTLGWVIGLTLGSILSGCVGFIIGFIIGGN